MILVAIVALAFAHNKNSSNIAVNIPEKNVRAITAYVSLPQYTSSHPFITASGARVFDGAVAANWLPLGAKVQIPALYGKKIFIVKDRMNLRYDDRVDIWMPELQKAKIFGIHYAEVVVLNPGPS